MNSMEVCRLRGHSFYCLRKRDGSLYRSRRTGKVAFYPSKKSALAALKKITP